MAQNCTDYGMCFEKRLDTNNDTIVDVLLIDPPDSILRLNVETIIEGKAFNGSVFNLNPELDERGYMVEYVDQVPPFQTVGDRIEINAVYHPGDPILYAQDTVVLYSFMIEGPPSDCVVFYPLANTIILAADGDNAAFQICNLDSLNTCRDSLCFPSVTVGGVIESFVDCEGEGAAPNEYGLDNVNVVIYQDSSTASYTVAPTTNQGDYEDVVAPEHDYTIVPEIDTSAFIDSCGVTEIDIAEIRRHILGKNVFTQPYQYVAADVSQDGNIGPLDIIRITKVVLDSPGVYLGWEFVEANSYSAISVPVSPPVVPSLPNSYTFFNLISNGSASFYGIKLGDVNLTCEECYRGGALNEEEPLLTRSSSRRFSLEWPQGVTTVGSTVKVPVYDEQFVEEGVLGFHLWVDPEFFTLEGIEPIGAFDTPYMYHSIDEDGFISMVWWSMQHTGVTQEEGLPLFYLNLKVNAAPTDWTQAIQLQHRPGRNVLVSNDGRVHDLNLQYQTESIGDESSGLSLNIMEQPFSDRLPYRLISNISEEVQIRLVNSTGQVVLQQRLSIFKGENDLILDGCAGLQPGLYMLYVESTQGKQVVARATKM